MKKALILVALLLPSFAMAEAGGVFKLIANDGAPDRAKLAAGAAESKASSTQSAPTFAAPTVSPTSTASPVVQKEAEVAKKELGNVTPKSVAKKEAQVAASQSGLDTKVKETKVKAKANKVLVEDGSAVLRYSTPDAKQAQAITDASQAKTTHQANEKAQRQATASEAKTSLEGKK
jgi:hypothetical protein